MQVDDRSLKCFAGSAIIIKLKNDGSTLRQQSSYGPYARKFFEADCDMSIYRTILGLRPSFCPNYGIIHVVCQLFFCNF